MVERVETRLAGIALALVLGLGLAACGGSSSSGGDSGPTTIGITGTTATGDAEAGREVFISTGCGSCHTLQEAGTDGVVGPNLDESLVLDAEAAGAQLADYVRTSIVDPDSVVMPQFSGGVMPTTYESQLSDEQLDDLVAFLVGVAQSG